ncbi:hypothetical protein ABPG77_005161 [Micractinium sp. CCAP 211/92]
MVARRLRGGSDDDEGSDRELQRARSGERRRVDPVIAEAHKRGLDVEKLHGSRTPAWRNLRGRGSQKKVQSYFEGPEDEDDELADEPPSDDDGEEESGSGEEEEEEEEEEESEEEEGEEEGEDTGRRYARRVRQTVQRYSPPKDEPPPRGRSRKRQGRHGDDEDAESDEEEDGQQDPDNDLFAMRYSVRQRRQVEFFDPVQYDGEFTGSQQPVDSTGPGGSRKRRDREQSRDERARRRQERHGLEAGEESDGEEDTQREPRRQYSFRDRALVTIKPASQQPAPSQGGGGGGGGGLHRHNSGRPSSGGQHERKRARLERRLGGGRLHRTGSRGRLRDMEDEVENLDEDPQLGVASHYAPAAGAAGVAGGSTGGTQVGSVPWELVRSAAANLPLSHLGRERAGNAEITPLQVDPSVTFDAVGGLDHYIKALKEMIFLPLVYPELFERFHIAPPRGVLFYGPPGTGKTLVARALAAHASCAGKKVSFFMRKGADVLSKWVGEAERQLRLLFEEAQRHQPSIIFFDEIDGLAPVRSSKQDQIHNSIVSTLLALMDGLDARGQVVVIGATNRVDALDGALRRPGRFDRELVFPLPNLSARTDILRIHTRKWAEPPAPELLDELASLCVGYCGADLKALCTEASLASLRRHYPQIYDADEKLLIDPGRVRVGKRDFLAAFQTITPASHRSAVANARPLPPLVAPVLLDALQRVQAQLQAGFPAAAACLRSGFGGGRNPAAGFGAPGAELGGGADLGGASSLGGVFSWASGASLGVQRPRLLVCGPEGTGQAHLGPAVLYALEGLPVHAIGLPSLLSDAGARAPEEALVHAVVEARRAAPAVLFLPHLQVWWDTAPNSLRATLWMLLADLPADLPLLLFATADVPASELDPAVRQLFNVQSGGAFELEAPTREQRSSFFRGIAEALALPPRPERGGEGKPPAPLPPLPRAPEAAAAEEEARRKAEEVAERQRYEEDQATLRTLRMILRDLTLDLLRQKRWELFWEPEEEEEWWDKVSEPMDLSTILSRVDARAYSTPHEYLADIAKIAQCSREFWGSDTRGVREISRASALEDEARSALAKALPQPLAARLEEMAASGGPAPPPASLLALPGMVQQDGGRTPGAALPMPRRPAHSEGGATSRRATRNAAAQPVDNSLLHIDPEAAARHIRALKKQQEAALAGSQQRQQPAEIDEREQEQLQEQQAHEQAFQEEQAEEEAERSPDAAQAAAAAATADAAAAVLVESTKENLPEPAPGAAAVAAATPLTDGIPAVGAASKHSGKGTLTAVVQQHGGSRLRCEAGATPPGAQAHAAHAAGTDQQAVAGLAPADDDAAAGGDARDQHQQKHAEAAEAAAGEEEPLPEYAPMAEDHARVDQLQAALAQRTEGLVLDSLESIHAKLARLAVDQRRVQNREEVVEMALAAVRDWIAARQHA